MAKTEAQILAEVFENTRALTRFYISRLKGTDMLQQFTVNGNTLNSAYWIIAHLAWTENLLLLKALEGPAVDVPWLEKFRISSKLNEADHLPDIKEVLHALNDIHVKAIDLLKSIPDEELDKENSTGLGFGGDNSKRMMIHHVIRHESIHAGHLGWLAKMHGIQTV